MLWCLYHSEQVFVVLFLSLSFLFFNYFKKSDNAVLEVDNIIDNTDCFVYYNMHLRSIIVLL